MLTAKPLLLVLATGLTWFSVCFVDAPAARAACRDSAQVGTSDGFLTGIAGQQCSPGSTGDPPGSSRDESNPPPPPPPPVLLSQAECLTRVRAGAVLSCESDEDEPGTPGRDGGFTAPSEAEVRVLLRLPDPTPRFGPDPSVNEWNMLVVGYPIWLWTDRPVRVSATATHDGLTMSLTAEWTSTRFEMGDGHGLTCADTTPYPRRPDRYGVGSPTCGYVYQERSGPGRGYTVTATTRWLVTWSAGGRSGALTTGYTGQRSLPIGELQALIKG